MDKARMDSIMVSAHGRKSNAAMMAHQGANAFLGGRSAFPAQNPLTATEGKSVFYASINAHKKGSKNWHK